VFAVVVAVAVAVIAIAIPVTNINNASIKTNPTLAFTPPSPLFSLTFNYYTTNIKNPRKMLGKKLTISKNLYMWLQLSQLFSFEFEINDLQQ
jgi:hypothetical protein